MRKFIKGNRVAVLTKPQGWYTQHQDVEKLFDADLIQRVLDQDSTVDPELQVEWLIAGDRFRPEMFRGHEVITVLQVGTTPITGSEWKEQNKDWLIA